MYVSCVLKLGWMSCTQIFLPMLIHLDMYSKFVLDMYSYICVWGAPAWDLLGT
uniref:Uncharacterized protein n=1 Tax=Aegilops tauschii subsp. strangulata TaxID=200361 RepID=A0A453F526_AEGTS